MKKIKTDKSTQSICNTLAYHDTELLVDNAKASRKPVTKKKEKVLFEFDRLNMTVSVPTFYVPKNNNNLGKIFAYVLSEITFDISGRPTSNEVRIPLRSFAKDGLYARANTAMKRLETAGKVLAHIDIEIKKAYEFNKSAMENYSYRCDGMFTGFAIDKERRELVVKINDDAPWSLFHNQYINVPDEWFALTARTFDLAQNLAMITRRSATTISRHGFIDIGLREVAFWLALPDDKNYNQGRRDIKNPIDVSVDELNNIRSDFTIEKHYDMSRKTSEFLNKGFIRVYVDGKTKAELVSIASKRTNLPSYIEI